MNIGFMGLGKIGCKLEGSLLRNGFALTVIDLKHGKLKLYSKVEQSGQILLMKLAQTTDLLITCLPNLQSVRDVMESPGGVLEGFRRVCYGWR